MKRKTNQIVTIRFDFLFGYVKIVNVKLKKKRKYIQSLHQAEMSQEDIWRHKMISGFLNKLAVQTSENNTISDEELERDYKFIGTSTRSFEGYHGNVRGLTTH